ncbi:MAG: right-handed parallel beta-helix repeat-containing protein [Thermoproteota archaeon]|nr:right-handed parallel beta-helix repeat-containing protein [Thermoproteota archaeon]
MEPKSIAFYTAVAVSILAVLSATTFPTLVQAQSTEDDVPAAEGEDEAITETEDEAATDNTETEDEAATDNTETAQEAEAKQQNSNSDNSNDNSAASQSLGLSPSSGVATCGEIVTEDVTLTSDLECGPGDGLIVGASGVTINLNGYSITSSDEAGSDPAMNYDGSSGILVTNADNVDISGLGEIDGFTNGVTFMGSSGGQVADVQLANNDVGVLMQNSEGTDVSRNTITNNGIALISDSSNHAAIAFNQIVANLEQGILLLGSDHNVVAANNMFGNGDNGIYLDIMSNDNTIDFNTVFGHEVADLNNDEGRSTNVNQNSFGENNNCGTSTPGGLCR